MNLNKLLLIFFVNKLFLYANEINIEKIANDFLDCGNIFISLEKKILNIIRTEDINNSLQIRFVVDTIYKYVKTKINLLSIDQQLNFKNGICEYVQYENFYKRGDIFKAYAYLLTSCIKNESIVIKNGIALGGMQLEYGDKICEKIKGTCFSFWLYIYWIIFNNDDGFYNSNVINTIFEMCEKYKYEEFDKIIDLLLN